MSIKEMKSALIENNMNYIRDCVIKDKHEELYEYVKWNYFSDFENFDDGEIIEMYGWLTEHQED